MDADFKKLLGDIGDTVKAADSMAAHPAFLAEVESAVERGWGRRERSDVPPAYQEHHWHEAAKTAAFERQVDLLTQAIDDQDAGAAAKAHAFASSMAGRDVDFFGTSSGSNYEAHRTVARCNSRARSLEGCGVRVAADAFDPLVFDCLRPTDALDRVQRWAGESGDGALLALVGGTGVGKTVAAAWALLELGGNAVRSDELSFLSASNYSADRERFHEIVNAHGLLVVDDVGTERDEAKARHGLFDLVDIRQGKSMRTLLTSNVTVEALRGRLCERTLSRLRAVGGLYSCKGTDMREAA